MVARGMLAGEARPLFVVSVYCDRAIWGPRGMRLAGEAYPLFVVSVCCGRANWAEPCPNRCPGQASAADNEKTSSFPAHLKPNSALLRRSTARRFVCLLLALSFAHVCPR